MFRIQLLCLLFAVSAQSLAAQEAECKVGDTLVTYSGIEERHAQAIARVVNLSAARGH